MHALVLSANTPRFGQDFFSLFGYIEVQHGMIQCNLRTIDDACEIITGVEGSIRRIVVRRMHLIFLQKTIKKKSPLQATAWEWALSIHRKEESDSILLLKAEDCWLHRGSPLCHQTDEIASLQKNKVNIQLEIKTSRIVSTARTRHIEVWSTWTMKVRRILHTRVKQSMWASI